MNTRIYIAPVKAEVFRNLWTSHPKSEKANPKFSNQRINSLVDF